MALILPYKDGRTLRTFPRALELKARGNIIMKNLKQIFFAVALVVGISLTASAQKKEDKKPPEKKPPVIVVTPKPPKEDKPKDGKKPQALIFNIKYELDSI